MIHLTISPLNNKPTLCGKQPGEVTTQLGWAFKMNPAVDCPECLAIYKVGTPMLDIFGHLPLSFEEFRE